LATGLYLMPDPATRSLAEFLRFHEQVNPFGGPLNASRWISLALFALGAFRHFRPRAAAA